MVYIERVDLLMTTKCGNARITELREAYRAFRNRCGWPAKEIAEMDAIIKADVADGPGAERSFEFPQHERIDCWAKWLKLA